MKKTKIIDGWYTEYSFHKNVGQSYKVEAILYQGQSQFQEIVVLKTASHGKLLLLDGKTMVSDLDEFVYHECMAHIPSVVAPGAKKVLVIGGGDGGVVREFTRHKNFEQIDLVEIDEEVINVCREFFPDCTKGLDDPRVTVHATDGIEFIKNHQNEYDIIAVDSTDPEDFAAGLFKEEFYHYVFSALTAQGIMVAQTENPFFDEFNIRDIYDNLRKVFPNVQSYWGPISIYPGTFWTFAFASKGPKGTDILEQKKLEVRGFQKDLKWYNLNWHQSAFQLSNIHSRITGVTT